MIEGIYGEEVNTSKHATRTHPNPTFPGKLACVARPSRGGERAGGLGEGGPSFPFPLPSPVGPSYAGYWEVIYRGKSDLGSLTTCHKGFTQSKTCAADFDYWPLDVECPSSSSFPHPPSSGVGYRGVARKSLSSSASVSQTDREDKLEEDEEIKAWALELSSEENSGCGIKVNSLNNPACDKAHHMWNE